MKYNLLLTCAGRGAVHSDAPLIRDRGFSRLEPSCVPGLQRTTIKLCCAAPGTSGSSWLP